MRTRFFSRTTPIAARPRCSLLPLIGSSGCCPRACGSETLSQLCTPASDSRGETYLHVSTSPPQACHDIRIDKVAHVPHSVREVHPARHPRPVCKPDLHRRRRLRLIHLKQRRHVRPLSTTRRHTLSSRERPRHAARRRSRHSRPKPVPSALERPFLRHIVLVRPLRHDHFYRLSRSHVQHRYRRTPRVDLREQPLVLGICIAVKPTPFDAESVAPKRDVALSSFVVLYIWASECDIAPSTETSQSLTSLLCIWIRHERARDLVAPQPMSATPKSTRLH